MYKFKRLSFFCKAVFIDLIYIDKYITDITF